MEYEKIKYPDGQISVKLTGTVVQIIERINSYEDLFLIKSIREVVKGDCDLVIPCLFGQRSDRRFYSNHSFDLKIIADFINSCNFNKVEIFDPHSDTALALINNSVKISSLPHVKRAILDIGTDLILVSPDAGAYKKIFEYGEELNLPVMAAVKHRDLAGTISLRFIGDVAGRDCLIVDDLLDGGYTFHLLAEKLKQQGANKVYLYVSHAYFHKGVDYTPYIDRFYCTDSVKVIDHPKVTQYEYR